MDDRELRRLALRQHGLVSRGQVLAAGGSDRTIRRQVALGRWEPIRRGVYVVGAAPATWHRTAMAALLAAGPDALLSGRSAVRLWGLVPRSGGLQLLVPSSRRVRLPGVAVRRTELLEPVDRAEVAGLAVTGLARSLIEVAPTQSSTTMGSMVDAAIRLHHLSIDDLAVQIDRLHRPGRPSPRSLIRALLLRQPGYDPGRSALESRVLHVVARQGLPVPVRQHRVVRPDGREAFLDLAYVADLLAIEVDGWEHHGQRAAFDHDRVRRNELVLLGWRVLNVTSAMTDAQIASTIAAALRR